MTTSTTSNTQQSSDVLFQKLGNTWFVFSQVGGEIVYSALPEGMSPHTTKLELFEVIEEHMTKVAGQNKRKPEVAL